MALSLQLLHECKRPMRVWRAAMRPDGAVAVFASYGDLSAWDVTTGACLWQRDTPELDPIPSALAFSPNGERLAVTGGNSLWWIDPRTGANLEHWPSVGKCNRALFSHDGRSLWLAGERLHRWDIASGQSVQSLSGGPKWILGLSQDAEGVRIAAVGEKSFYLWVVPTGELWRRYSVARIGTNSVALSADGHSAWTGEAGPKASCWSLEKAKKKELLALASPPGGPRELCLDHEGRHLWIATENGLWVHRSSNGALLTGHELDSWADEISLSRDGATACSAHVDNTGRIWRLSGESAR